MATPDPFGGDVPTIRREARERAVALLYEAHMKDVPPGDLLAGLDVAGKAHVDHPAYPTLVPGA